MILLNLNNPQFAFPVLHSQNYWKLYINIIMAKGPRLSAQYFLRKDSNIYKHSLLMVLLTHNIGWWEFIKSHIQKGYSWNAIKKSKAQYRRPVSKTLHFRRLFQSHNYVIKLKDFFYSVKFVSLKPKISWAMLRARGLFNSSPEVGVIFLRHARFYIICTTFTQSLDRQSLFVNFTYTFHIIITLSPSTFIKLAWNRLAEL